MNSFLLAEVDWMIVGIAIAASVIGGLILVLIIIFAVPQLRKKVLPYRDREHFKMQEKNIY